MELFPRTIIFPLILFVICSVWVCIAIDCGSANVSRITVDKSGQANFKTIQAAIDSVPINNNQWVNIIIGPGTYMEKVQIPYEKPCIFLKGSGKELTTITYNDHQETDTSATFSSFPNNVVANGITFENSFNVATMLNLRRRKLVGNVVPALAARVYGDKSAFYNCRFIGFQDTLWSVQGRQYFKNCTILGAVDFIFGGGQSYFEDCILNATSAGFITAQKRSSPNDPSGFVFRRGNVIGSGNNDTLLGRAYGPYSRVIFYGTQLSSVVASRGWDAWLYSKQEARFTYAEFECGGPGSDTSKRVSWVKTKLSDSELSQFSVSAFIDQDGWLAKINNLTLLLGTKNSWWRS